MNKTKHSPKILIVYGPNMNLLGMLYKNKISMDKLNKQMRKTAKYFDLELIIFQSNEEGKAITRLQRQRKKIKGIILFPGPWQSSGYVLLNTLEILNIPYVTVSSNKSKTIFKGIQNITNKNLDQAADLALQIIKENLI